MGVARGTFLSGLHGLLGISTTGCLRGVVLNMSHRRSNNVKHGGIHGNIWGCMKWFEVTICYYCPHRPHIMKAISAISFNMTYNILNNGSSSSVTAKGGMDHDGPSKRAFPDFVTWSLTNFLEGRPEKLLEYKHQHGLNWIWLDDVGCIHDVFCVKAGA